MKYLTTTTAAILAILLVTFAACKKDEVAKDADKFDINSPVGYFIYVKQQVQTNDSATGILQGLYEFLPEKKLRMHEAISDGNNSRLFSYEVVDGHVIALTDSDLKFVIENGQVTSNYTHFRMLALLKASETNQLAGKTFSGTYYKSDRSVLHQNFFYSFAGKDNKVDAGFSVGTALRTENYRSIGNIAARIAVVGNDDLEFMVLMNGKLEVSYYDKNLDALYHGSFAQ